ncbi:SNF2 family N-terminal domain-containing protein [Sporodiniella umbellata]|nr:SNF2 family N-terminal domain-containing protein [Sporodiniella umbellata]
MDIPTNHPQVGFYKEKIHSLVQRARLLQSQGANKNNNPEYAQIMIFLKDLQERSEPTNDLAPAQVNTLKHQLLAYKLISKNVPLPQHLQPANCPLETPLESDPHTTISQRENRLSNRFKHRIQELESLPSNLSSAKVRALVELKSLRLMERQHRLREEIISGMTRSTTLATCADRLAYRRMKKQTLREARMTEKMERQQRTDRERRDKQKHLDYLQTICDHGRRLVFFHSNEKTKKNKLGRAVIQYHQHMEREEQKKLERVSKERIRALKNDDEEAYMKLIDEAKDTRLTQLLKQTGMFLDSLTRAVKEQQSDSIYSDVLIEREIEDEAGDSEAKSDYYQVTHRIKEEVSQPTILVGGKLKDYQLKGLQWMVSLFNNHLNGILADEMGLGKTIQTISLITYLIEKKRQPGPFLIIVPLSTLTNWTLEFEKWAPAVKKIVYKGPPNLRRELQNEIRYNDFQVLLTTFEYIIKDRPILSKVKWLHMIVDEGHRMKNSNSKLTVVLRQFYHTKYRLILTGTPLQNNLPELWALLNFILPKIFKSVKSFEEWFNTPFSTQGVADKVGLNEEEQLLIIKRLHKVLRPFLLRRLKRDVESELPDKVERVIKCKLSSLQTHLYTQMKRNGTLYTSSGSKGKSGIKGLNNTIMQLRKICNHPFVYEEVETLVNPSGISNNLLYRVSGKFELLDRMLPKLQQTGHRVLIFFQMTQVMSIMEDFLNYRGFSYLRLDGSTKSDDRSELLRLFNDPQSPYFIFLLSTRAGGLGLNLQTADTVIIFDSDWNPHQDLQAQDRAHRIGQTKEVRIFRLISTHSVEENILARANYKLDIDGKVIQAGKFDNKSTEEDREAFLKSLLEDKGDEISEAEDEEIDDDELNEILQRSETEVEVFQKIDKERNQFDARQWRALGLRGKPERLITESELPDVYLNDDPIQNEVVDPLTLGRGQRSKESVRYDDGLTEEQWLNALEDDNVNLDELILRKEQRRLRRANKLLSNTDTNNQTDDVLEDSASRKRGRPKRNEIENKHKRSRRGEDLSGENISPVPETLLGVDTVV